MPAKKAASTKKAPARPRGKIESAFTKKELVDKLAEMTDLKAVDIKNVLQSLNDIMFLHLKKNGPGEFTLPGLIKCRVVRKPATKARKGVNPFTGEETTFKAKPAHNVVKIRVLKKLKEMVE